MFKKLNLQLKTTKNLTRCKGELIVNYGKINYFKFTRSYQYLPSNILSLNPESIHWAEINPEEVDPHIDTGTLASINVYVNPSHAITRLFRPKAGAESWRPQTDDFLINLGLEAKSFRREDLDLVDQFVAEPFEAYLLDVSQVHDIIEIDEVPRSMIQIHFRNKNYDQVLSNLEGLGYC